MSFSSSHSASPCPIPPLDLAPTIKMLIFFSSTLRKESDPCQPWASFETLACLSVASLVTSALLHGDRWQADSHGPVHRWRSSAALGGRQTGSSLCIHREATKVGSSLKKLDQGCSVPIRGGHWQTPWSHVKLGAGLPAEMGLGAGRLGNGMRKDRKLLPMSRNARPCWVKGRRRGSGGERQISISCWLCPLGWCVCNGLSTKRKCCLCLSAGGRQLKWGGGELWEQTKKEEMAWKWKLPEHHKASWKKWALLQDSRSQHVANAN